ncbi:MAG: DGQHR domain-containing protein [Ignavibacteria bacterium]|nr:DGQHR domain-containing protein [Ignavibacteria bacterium]
MKYEELSYESSSYICLEVEALNQTDKQFFVGKIPAKVFTDLYTVEPVRYDFEKYSSLADIEDPDDDYYFRIAEEKKKLFYEGGAQREFDASRVSKIAEFLNEDEHPFFPNTIIATCDLVNNLDELLLTEDSSEEDFFRTKSRPRNASFFQKTNDTYKLFIPKERNTILVIDGQHRLRGIEKANLENRGGYELLIAFILGFDRSVIAKLFYTINYEQKPINKSLLYHLTGEFSTDITPISFLHYTVKLLNESKKSPFFAKIKMLGVMPRDLPSESRKQVSISQAFLIDELKRLILCNRSTKTYIRPIFRYYFLNEELQIELIRFIIKFFTVVMELKISLWDDPSTSSLSKGIGVGALLKVMNVVFIELFVNSWGCDPKAIRYVKKAEIEILLSGFESFNYTEETKGVGGMSGISSLANKIILGLDHFSIGGKADFQSVFQVRTLPKFDQWLNENKSTLECF